MQALTTLFPVFFMLILGFIAKLKKWITPEQKTGANTIIFNILFPIMIFNLLATASIEFNHIYIIGYVFVIYVLSIVFGKIIIPYLSKDHAHYAHYLLSCCEGGNVALPLYLSIVGSSSNTVIFDIAGTAVTFVIIPIMVAKEASKGTTTKQLVKAIFTNSFVIAVIFGLFFNFSGIYAMLLNSQFGAMISGTITQVTAPIVPMILFILGYDLSIDKETIKPLIKLMGLKTIYYAFVIAGFFIFFPSYMQDPIFMIAPIIYFMCPTGFPMPQIISPVFKSEEDAQFSSSFISIYIIITLIVYTCVVLFIA